MAKINLKRLNSSSSDDSFKSKETDKERKKRKLLHKILHTPSSFHLPVSTYYEMVDIDHEKRVNINSLMEEVKTLKKKLADYKANNESIAKENERLRQLNRHNQNYIAQLKMDLHEDKLKIDEYKRDLKHLNDELKRVSLADKSVVSKSDKSTTVELVFNQTEEFKSDNQKSSVQATRNVTMCTTKKLVRTNTIRKYLNKKDQFLKAIDEFEEPIQQTSLHSALLNENTFYDIDDDDDDDRSCFIDFSDNSTQIHEQQNNVDSDISKNSKSKNLRSPLSTLINRKLNECRSPFIRTCDLGTTQKDKVVLNEENKENHLKRPRAPVSYKEPNLKCKVRRDKLNQVIYVLKQNNLQQ